jgi:predicted nucleotidyltransferase
MNKLIILKYLKNKKDELHKHYGIEKLGLYGSYARDEATPLSDVDIFYTRDSKFELKSGL